MEMKMNLATKTISFQARYPDRGRRVALPVPSLTPPCTCPVPVYCYTDGEGGLSQRCLRCGATNAVERRPGIATISKARAAELTMFGRQGERP